MALVTFVAASTVVAAATSSADGLIVTNPLPGYERLEGGLLDGEIGGETLMELTGVDPDDVPDELLEFSGQARTWVNDEGAVAVAFVIDCGDLDTAKNFLRGALAGSKQSSASSFESGLTGTAGFFVEQPTGPARSVIWRQSRYFVEVFVVGVTGDSSEDDTKALAASQAAFLRTTMGEPTLDTSGSTSGSGLGYEIGRIVGTLFFVGIIALMIWSAHKRKAARRARASLFAVSLAPFTPAGFATTQSPPPPPPPPPSPPLS